MGFEIVEQLGWRAPRHTVAPMCQRIAADQDREGVSGSDQGRPHRGATLYDPWCAGDRMQSDFDRVQGRDGPDPARAEAEDHCEIARDRHACGRLLRGQRDALHWRRVRGRASDEEIVEGIRLLAETEGIFAETAGGVTVACAKKLIAAGKIPTNESVVLCITGHGLKTAEAVAPHLPAPRLIENPSLREFDARRRERYRPPCGGGVVYGIRQEEHEKKQSHNNPSS